MGGQTTAQMASDASTQVDAVFDPSCYNILIFLEGRNQMSVGSTPTESAFQTLSYCAQRRSRGFYVLVMDTLPSNESSFQASLLSYNEIVRSGWKNYADAYLDCRRDIPQIQTGAMLPDGIHPSATGHCYIAAAVCSAISSIPLRR